MALVSSHLRCIPTRKALRKAPRSISSMGGCLGLWAPRHLTRTQDVVQRWCQAVLGKALLEEIPTPNGFKSFGHQEADAHWDAVELCDVVPQDTEPWLSRELWARIG